MKKGDSFEIIIDAGQQSHALKCVIEYQSSSIMRIRVFGKQSSILLENNFPFVSATQSRQQLNWKLKEGNLKGSSEKNAKLMAYIMEQLEYKIKNYKGN
ncbi:MAG: hypothetical protein JSU03_04465 [Bacteroidetes bacterium]|nr:hypothetical protein [Bacteroidota bacterium]MBS1756509.1 hypothetical protein [Bacteroidota bacterium]